MIAWIKMVKDGEEKLVHPANVKNHERAGWTVADQAAAVEPVPEAIPADQPEPVVEEAVAPDPVAAEEAEKKPAGRSRSRSNKPKVG